MPIGKYGMLRKAFLKTERKGMYAHLMLTEQLNHYLTDIDRTAREQIEQTMQELLRLNPAPDKASDPLAWTGHMNNLKRQAEELILTELIYH
ncbi:TnpV protein [Paenibacillus sp. J5C_2022]|uniref:TnpV protein n=1 Tax=Paenibacillus sp. J5C2022 TaxID=2977129 RepID=UPI0021CEF7C8|nr:TnpV protein [Paenibacillus sp. J5C2022]MCU6711500.1 TnpV protein [Paenibacillus sp. J5C2022]